jgi:hypothetical protein
VDNFVPGWGQPWATTQKGTEVQACDDVGNRSSRRSFPGFSTSSTRVVPNAPVTNVELSTVCTGVNAVVLILLKPRIQGITLKKIIVPLATRRYDSMEAPAANRRKRKGVA